VTVGYRDQSGFWPLPEWQLAWPHLATLREHGSPDRNR